MKTRDRSTKPKISGMNQHISDVTIVTQKIAYLRCTGYWFLLPLSVV